MQDPVLLARVCLTLARQRQDEPRRIHLTAATLRRVFEHIESRLADPTALRLHNLAHIARVSEDHFVRAFRASVGQTPHQYLVARRIDTARELLKGAALPIAHCRCRLGCGFQQRQPFFSRVWPAGGCGAGAVAARCVGLNPLD